MEQDCASSRDDLAAYVLGALDGEECAAMKRHLMACPGCRAEYEDLLPIRDWLVRTRRHLAACRACRADYEDLLRLRPAHSGVNTPPSVR
ncbi:MAG: anti-sigma factor family protein [Trebonia sp.]